MERKVTEKEKRSHKKPRYPEAWIWDKKTVKKPGEYEILLRAGG